MTDANLLKQFVFFAPFSAVQLQHVLDTAPRVRLGVHEVVFYFGDQSGAMYLILDGQVKIHRVDEHGNEVVLITLERGQVFGELALLSNEPRMATATTLTPCEFLLIDRALLLDMIASASPEAILQMFAVLSNQIRAINEREFRQLLETRTLASEMEAERQRNLTQMVAGVAHELNTPLGVANTAVSVIEREIESPAFKATMNDGALKRPFGKIREASSLITSNIQRAHKLVEDFKKVSVSQLSDVKESVNLPEVVNETLNLAKIYLKHSGLTITFMDDLPLAQKQWIGYRGHFSQVLLNLLTNVERYAYPNGAGGIVEIRLALAAQDQFALSVRDYGHGMSDDVRERIFEPFFTTGRERGGTGLGMTIVHSLVTSALKGHIHIHSAPNQGTEVVVTFPRHVPN
jgi:signal transduction histidine kinase